MLAANKHLPVWGNPDGCHNIYLLDRELSSQAVSRLLQQTAHFFLSCRYSTSDTMLAMEPNAPRTVNNVEVICIASLGKDFPRELHTRLHSALTGWQATVFYRTPSTKEEKTRLGRWASTCIPLYSILSVCQTNQRKIAPRSWRMDLGRL